MPRSLRVLVIKIKSLLTCNLVKGYQLFQMSAPITNIEDNCTFPIHFIKKYAMSKSYYKFTKIKEIIIYIMNYNLYLHTFEKATYMCARHYLFTLQSMVAASIDLQTLIKILKYHQGSIGYKLGTTL